MQDSIIRSYNLSGQEDLESNAAANPPARLIATAAGTPMRVLCTTGNGPGIVSVAFDQAQLRNLDPIGLVPGGDVFTPLGGGTFANGTSVFILAPSQKLYAVTLNGDQTVNVATSDSVEIAQVLAQAKRASGVASRLYVVNFEIDALTGEAVPRVQNNPPILAAAPDWSPMRVTVLLPISPPLVQRRLDVSEDSDLLRQGSTGNPFRMLSSNAAGSQVTFVLAPNQTLYGVANTSVGQPNVPVFVSTTLFTDVFNPKVLAAMPDNQMRALWNNLWQGSDGVCF